MISLNFSVKEILFSLIRIWDNLGLNSEEIEFKHHLVQTIKNTNSLEEVVVLNVTKDVLLRCYVSVSQQPYGSTTDMAEILLDSLRTQLFQKVSVQTEENTPEHFEKLTSLEILSKVQELKLIDTQTCDNNIEETRLQILR